MIAISKRATPSNGKDPLENFAKLSDYASQGSDLIQQRAKKEGITITIMKNGKIFRIHPDGKEVEIVQSKQQKQNSFEPIETIK